jgi:hypothetical protein
VHLRSSSSSKSLAASFVCRSSLQHPILLLKNLLLQCVLLPLLVLIRSLPPRSSASSSTSWRIWAVYFCWI